MSIKNLLNIKNIKIKKRALLPMILGALVVLIAGTYAFFSWISRETALVFTVGNISGLKVTIKPYQVNLNLVPVDDYDETGLVYDDTETHDGINYIEILANNRSNVSKNFFLYYDIETISPELRNADFRYTIVKSTDNFSTQQVVKSSDFSTANNNIEIPVFGDSVAGNTQVKYRVYMWIKNENYDQSLMLDKVFKASLIAKFELTANFAYIGNYQVFTAVIPGYYKVEAWGAQGGTAYAGYAGGKGAYTTGTVYLAENEKLYVYVGGQGSVTSSEASQTAAGGYNGGGDGFNDTATGRYAGGGGGGTDIRYFGSTTPTFSDLYWNSEAGRLARIMVAAGGGGSWYRSGSYYGYGGNGGTITGGAGTGSNNGTAVSASGGTQNGSNSSGTSLAYPGIHGLFGVGDSYSGSGSDYCGGGGGGWFGGFVAKYTAGGGSSYISGYPDCLAYSRTCTNNGNSCSYSSARGTSAHSSGKAFNNMQMIAGVNTGNGKAKISFVGANDPNYRSSNHEVIEYGDYGYAVYNAPQSGYYKLETWGAQGGDVDSTYIGGKGAYAAGTIYLAQNEKVYIYVGGQGSATSNAAKQVALGGYNGGGAGYNNNSASRYAASGGGATDVRYFGNSTPTVGDLEWNSINGLSSRIMVAGGGGGSYYYNTNNYSSGGNGGTLTGGASSGKSGNNAVSATGGTQTATSFGVGVSYTGTNAIAGGGGGYYGGNTAALSGGGGSSFISGYPGCNAIVTNLYVDTPTHTGQSGHYSGKSFNDMKMTAGVRSGNGKAEITFINANDPNYLSGTHELIGYNDDIGYVVYNAPQTGYYQVEAWGAQGGTAYEGYNGGKGAYTKGTLYLTQNEKLYVYVGSQGEVTSSVAKRVAKGGANGGGDGYNHTSDGRYAGGGGGATDIRYFGSSTPTVGTLEWNSTLGLNSRIMVAAGGGGSWYYNGSYYGVNNTGGGGTMMGVSGTGYNNGTWGYIAGGTQTSGNAFGVGASYTGTNSRAGAGGGYYGGTNANFYNGSGGSSFISGHSSCNAITSDSDRTASGQPVHYSGKAFINSTMTAGNNTGDGKAEITYLGTDNPHVRNGEEETILYDGNNNYTVYTAPVTGYYKIEAWGAEGGTAYSGYPAGKGAYTSGYIYLAQNEKIYVYVGGQGGSTVNARFIEGGYNGGGNGFPNAGGGRYGGSGGGATDIRYFGNATPSDADLRWDSTLGLNSRIMVAAGGAGSWYYNTSTYGHSGAGGTLIGAAGTSSNTTEATGGTQTATSFGIGVSATGTQTRPGGGAGYYGGNNGNYRAGGGSSFVSGFAGVNAITAANDRTHTAGTLHYSNKYFVLGDMEEGINSGDGKAQITYVGSTMTKMHNRLDNVRYIKDCTNGNSANAYNQWVEIQAIKDGVNVAKGKTVTGTVNAKSGYAYTKIVDGDIASSNYAQSNSNGNQCVTVDLGAIYNLDEIAVWHYYTGGRTYNGKVLSVSSDNSTYTTVMVPAANNSPETAEGFRVSAYSTNNIDGLSGYKIHYTGSYKIGSGIYDGTYDWLTVTAPFEIYFLSSGTLTFNTNVDIDAFLVGGGGANASISNVDSNGGITGICYGNGGGGYHTVLNDVSLTANTNYAITVGTVSHGTTAFGTTVNPGTNGYARRGYGNSLDCGNGTGGTACGLFETSGSTYSGGSGSTANTGKGGQSGVVVIRNAS